MSSADASDCEGALLARCACSGALWAAVQVALIKVHASGSFLRCPSVLARAKLGG